MNILSDGAFFYIIGEKLPVFRTSKCERVNTTLLMSINKIRIIIILNVETVSNCLQSMSKGKVAGTDGIEVEHFLYTNSVVVVPSSTQPCIPPGSLNRLPASAGVKAGKPPLPGGR